ncbi:MAG: SANT/Myb-like DNA-binding domain-containing protein [Propionibacteriaceae bacterium]|nr:SANT/Myb-like DNA-binding domain-containing protein [Propionibacteriaceae bacterium]
MKKQHWTPAEDELLRQHGPTLPWPELEALLPGRTQAAIRKRVCHLGIARQAEHLPWTPAEDALLREHGSTLPWPELEALLPGRTQAAIRKRVCHLGIARQAEHLPWTPAEDALLREHGSTLPWPELEALLPGRTQAAIRKRVCHLGIARQAEHLPWTPAEDALLRQHGPTMPWEELEALLPGRTQVAIRARLRHLGIARQAGHLLWSVEEDELLRKFRPTTSWEDLATRLPGRTLTAIKRRCRTLNITPREPVWAWTDEEEAVLYSLPLHAGKEAFLEALPGRSWKAIQARLRRRKREQAVGAMPVVRWTPEEEALLHKHGPNMSLSELKALLPGRTETAIYTRLRTLGITHLLEQIPWSREEDELLRELGATAVWKEVKAAFPQRSEDALRQRLHQLGVSRRSLAGNRTGQRAPDWSIQEDTLLREHGSTASWEQLEALLPSRTRSAIQQRFNNLGLQREGRRWQETEDTLLRFFGARAPWAELHNALPHRSVRALVFRLHRLGIKRVGQGRTWTRQDQDDLRRYLAGDLHTPPAPGRSWTPTEEQLLHQHGPTMPWDELEAMLPGRSRKAITTRLARLGIRRTVRAGEWTPAELETLSELEHADRDTLMAAFPTRTWTAIYARLTTQRHTAGRTRPRRSWTPAENTLLHEHGPTASWQELHALLPGRSLKSIRIQMNRLAIYRAPTTHYSPTRRSWTPTEEQLLHQHGPTMPWEELEALLPGRTLDAIKARLTHLGVRRVTTRSSPRRPWTPAEDAILRELGHAADMSTLKAALPDRAEEAIRYRLRTLNLPRMR